MHQPIDPTTLTVTFVLRFWRERTASEVRWRGRIEHVQSGESAAFLEFDTMLSFLQRYGISAQDQNLLTSEEL